MSTTLTLKHNPTTITAPVYVLGSGDAVYGRSGIAWRVTNLSVITDVSTYGAGIVLRSGGSITNGAPGSTGASIAGNSYGIVITGAPGTVKNFGKIPSPGAYSVYGISLEDGGSVINGVVGVTSASIAGGNGPGVIISGEAGTVTNFGSIIGGSGGIKLERGGTVTNGGTGSTKASISGDTYGIYIGTTAGTVKNFGRIVGEVLENGGTVSNGQAGVSVASISGYEQGVQIVNGLGALRNFGRITATHNGGGIPSYGASLSDGGSVNNGKGGSITGGAGVAISGAGTVTNFGRIAGRVSTGVSLATGAVTNEAGASIGGGGEGVRIGSDGTVTNFGHISGTDLGGVYLSHGGDVINGGPGSTSASIYGARTGVDISPAFGSVTNFGKITGHTLDGLLLHDGGAVTNGGVGATSAKISGGRTGVDIGAAAGTMANFGSIVGVDLYGVALSGGGDVINGGSRTKSALIRGKTGIEIALVAGTVTNFGTIAGRSSDGVSLGDGGSVTNGGSGALSASISGSVTGVALSDFFKGETATLTNLGIITGDSSYGVSLHGNGGIITNGEAGAAGATISGGKTGVLIAADTGTVKNFGTIIGAGGTAVQFLGREVLVVEPGAKFLGASGKPGIVDGGQGSTLELAAKSSGALLLGAQFIHFTTVIVDSGADWRVDFGLTSLTGETITGNGTNVLAFTDAGTFDLSAVRGFPTVSLANTGPNALTLLSSNFIGVAGKVITVEGSSNSDTLSEAGVTAADHAVLRGGAGDDTLVAGRNAALTGGSGKDLFVFTVPGSAATPDTNTIADFAHGTDKLAFGETGFGLGLAPVAATLFTANPTGSFTAATQQFAYDTATGALYARGAGSSQLLVATLTGHPTLTAGDITFVS